MSPSPLYILLILLPLGGFFLAFFIWYKKSGKREMVCPLKARCDLVIHSDHSRFLGVPVEILGMLYYGIIALSFGSFLIFPQLISSFWIFILYLLTISAFLFSLYLTFLQAFTIRNWCFWCIVSTGICTAIFIVALTGSVFPLAGILMRYREPLELVNVMSMALGVGSATIGDILFLKFLRDLKISNDESGVLSTVFHVIWLALGVVIITEFGLFIPDAEKLGSANQLMGRIITIGIIVVNGAFLNLFITPRMVDVSFGKGRLRAIELRRLRKMAFAMVSISIVSWYSAWIFSSLKNSYDLVFLLSAYLIALLVGIVIGRRIEKHFGGQSGFTHVQS